MKKSTMVAFAFFCLMSLAIFPYDALASAGFNVSSWETPSAHNPVKFTVTASNDDPTFHYVKFFDSLGIIEFPAAEFTAVPYDRPFSVTITMPYGTYAAGRIKVKSCTWNCAIVQSTWSGFPSFTVSKIPSATSTLIITGFGMLLWNEVAANLVLVFSIVAVVGLIFMVVNYIVWWKK